MGVLFVFTLRKSVKLLGQSWGQGWVDFLLTNGSFHSLFILTL